MANKESTFLNMVMTLLCVSLISSTALGYVYELTKAPKAAADLAKKVKAIKMVIPDFTNNPIDEKKEVPTQEGNLIFYPVKKGDQLMGYAIETFTKDGFGGEIKLMVGFLTDGTISDIAVIDHKETPGLGDKIDQKKSDFVKQFKKQNPSQFTLKVAKDGGDVDGITAATISSRAFCDAVQRAYDSYQKEAQN